jgi:hypothetical protein
LGNAGSGGIAGLSTAGGGAGQSNTLNRGISGTANTGGGGGGGSSTDQNSSTRSGGGAGGSGIVIIRYPANCAPPTSTTGNPQINYADGYQIYTWTSNGTVTF